MPDNATEVTSGVPEEWQGDHLATVFTRWHRHLEQFSAQSTALLIAAANVERNDTVLDIACGSGIPSLQIAEIVGPIGRVVAVDPSPIFLNAVAANAQERGITNLQAVPGGGEHLPFEANSFDAATCHFGVMFFMDVNAALTSIRKVLRPGARAGFAAWGPIEANAYFRSFMGVIQSFLPPPPPEPGPAPSPEDIPQPMRFAAAGSLARALTGAGYHDVQERMEPVEMVWMEPRETAVSMFLEVSQALDRLPVEQHQLLRDALLAAIEPYRDGEIYRYPADVVIASGAA
jgi:SAM-dependent methyltransferase